jgi:hypothetical protein
MFAPDSYVKKANLYRFYEIFFLNTGTSLMKFMNKAVTIRMALMARLLVSHHKKIVLPFKSKQLVKHQFYRFARSANDFQSL